MKNMTAKNVLVVVAVLGQFHLSIAGSSTDFLERRCGEETTIWAYTGSLTDPLNGNEICSVQGLEVIEPVAHIDNDDENSNPISRFRRRCGNLHIADALTEDHSLVRFNGASTFVSRKFFCYTPKQNSRFMLNQFRKRPAGPVTKIPVSQAATVFDSFVTSIQTTENTLLHAQLQDTSVWANAVTEQRNGQLTLFFRPRSRPLHPADLAEAASHGGKNSASTTTVAPARSALVQFGASKSEGLKFGARESYSFGSNNNDRESTNIMYYSRYGEAPVWYGPSRMCQLQMKGQRCSSMDMAQLVAPAAFAGVKKYVSKFWNIFPHMPTKYTDDSTEDPVFRYYADALHPAFADPDASSQASSPCTLSSCAEYRRYYRDLAMARAISDVRTHPVQLDLSSTNQKWTSGIARLYDRIRAATSVSIGGDDEP